PLAGSTGAELLDWVLDYIGWPAGLRDFDSSEFTHGPLRLSSRSALEVTQAITDAELGVYFVSANGKLTTVARESLLNKATAYTVADDSSDTGILVNSLQQTQKKSTIIIEVPVARGRGSSAATVRDDDSIAAYGPRSREYSNLELASDTQSRILAESII